MTPRVAIALGDPSGIGPEVALKALALESAEDGTAYFIVGDKNVALTLNDQLGLRLPLASSSRSDPEPRFQILGTPVIPFTEKFEPGSIDAAVTAMAALEAGAQLCMKGDAQALVTAPVNKRAIINAGHPEFVGQTELLSRWAQADRTAMMLLGHDDRGRWLRVALATTHVRVRDIARSLTRENVINAIWLAAEACQKLKLPRARVAVCGLNPHAGEGGKLGTEELDLIQPAVDQVREDGLDVVGPLSADALFYYALRGDYDAVVAMYHDQGLAPLKMVCFDHGVNWTLGLPFVRTSPDHGTAYDIAGKGIANPSSMVAALRLAKQLIAQ
jgi:4-hydroxythreonine-4-phosphate dehydrogenase